MITQYNFPVLKEIISLCVSLSLIKPGAVESWTPEICCLSLLMPCIGHTGGENEVGEWVYVQALATVGANCLSVHYSSIITAWVLSCLLYCMCDYYTDALRFSWTWHTQTLFWGKRHSSTTVAKLKSKVCVLISDGSFMNDSFNASVIWQMNEKRRRWTNHLCFLISYLISWGCIIMNPYFMIKDCVWTCTGNLAIENITF